MFVSDLLVGIVELMWFMKFDKCFKLIVEDIVFLFGLRLNVVGWLGYVRFGVEFFMIFL